jgi:arylsulfatase A-like enzyme
MWSNTDLYIVGNHGDTYYANSEETGETLYQHTTIPFHTTTHVPLIAKCDYLKPGDIHELVSGVDIYSTILNSAGIEYKNKLGNLGSIDLKKSKRKYVVSQNMFIGEEDGSFSITDDSFIYAEGKDKEYLFNHILDNLNVCNLLKGEDFLIEHKDTNHPHLTNWFTPEVLIQSRDKVKEFKEIAKDLREKGYLRQS